MSNTKQNITDPYVEDVYTNNKDDVGALISGLFDIEDKLDTSTIKGDVRKLLFDVLVEKYESGDISNSELEMYAGDIADLSGISEPKTTIVNIVNDRVSTPQDAQKVKHINDWVLDNVNYVLVVKSEDKHADTKYQFKITDSSEYIESEGMHRSWNEFKNKIHELSLERVAKPNFPDNSQYDAGDWTDFIDDFITQNHKTKVVPGTRSEYVKELQSNIRRAYTDQSQAVDTNQAYYDEDNDLLWIPSSMISRVIKNGINAEELWCELNARGIVDGKASHKLYSDTNTSNDGEGHQKRYWRVDSSFTDFKTVDKDETTENIANSRIEETK